MSDFEYLGWSAFWGLVLLVFVELLLQNYPYINKLIADPLPTGLVSSFFGLIFGVFFGKLQSYIEYFRKWAKKIISK